jgi:hypothetical protein
MLRSANTRTTWAAESGRLQYHLMAIKITSGGLLCKMQTGKSAVRVHA